MRIFITKELYIFIKTLEEILILENLKLNFFHTYIGIKDFEKIVFGVRLKNCLKYYKNFS